MRALISACLAVVRFGPRGLEVLVQRRKDPVRKGEFLYWWVLPGGEAHDGESEWECSLREAWEELQVDFSGAERRATPYVIPSKLKGNEGRHYGLCVVRVASEEAFEFVLDPKETTAMRWVGLDELISTGLVGEERFMDFQQRNFLPLVAEVFVPALA